MDQNQFSKKMLLHGLHYERKRKRRLYSLNVVKFIIKIHIINFFNNVLTYKYFLVLAKQN